MGCEELDTTEWLNWTESITLPLTELFLHKDGRTFSTTSWNAFCGFPISVFSRTTRNQVLGCRAFQPGCCCCLVTQSCPTLCNPMGCSPPGSSVHGILQARILGCVAMPSSRGSSEPREGTQVSHSAGGFFTTWASREMNHSINKYEHPDTDWGFSHSKEILGTAVN